MNTDKPKLLLIAAYFPPAYKSTGSIRPWNMAKNLVSLGWEVTVVTLNPSVWKKKYIQKPGEIEKEIQQLGIKRILTDYRWRFLAPGRVVIPDNIVYRSFSRLAGKIMETTGMDNWTGWLGAAEKACSSLTSKDVDIILATGAPFVSFTLAERLSRRLERPFVLDYRDLWTSNPWQKPKGRRERSQERRLLAKSAAVTVISPSIRRVLMQEYGLVEKIQVVTNGFDQAMIDLVKPQEFGEFAIVYTGAIWLVNRTNAIMAFLKELEAAPDSRKRAWRFHYYGDDGQLIKKCAQDYGILHRVVDHGKVNLGTSLEAVKGASLAIIVTVVTQQPTLADKGVVTGKIFEVIGSSTPLLVMCPPGSDVEEIVATSGSGRCFEPGDLPAMVSFVLDIMQGQVPQRKSPETFAWANLAQKFSELLAGFIPARE